MHFYSPSTNNVVSSDAESVNNVTYVEINECKKNCWNTLKMDWLTKATLKTLLVRSVRNSRLCGSCLSEGLKHLPASTTSETPELLRDLCKPKLALLGVAGDEGTYTLLLLRFSVYPEYELLDDLVETLTLFISLIFWRFLAGLFCTLILRLEYCVLNRVNSERLICSSTIDKCYITMLTDDQTL